MLCLSGQLARKHVEASRQEMICYETIWKANDLDCIGSSVKADRSVIHTLLDSKRYSFSLTYQHDCLKLLQTDIKIDRN
ncbi:cys-loop ligand-gated ion channel-like X3 [Biomphalaria pfeifferi]|uniref:Cys-loop ligand-gated ion channel-like X3 n=1 Tax=Biomphalaria pfeifferi TaxID=112525 RepID=A0AAD8AU85_BIOPF|nr:cys-loop ligand-gated ion channel-like X3 [Biomphalaria pfeifferi]